MHSCQFFPTLLILFDGHDKTKTKKANIKGIGMSNTQFRWLVC